MTSEARGNAMARVGKAWANLVEQRNIPRHAKPRPSLWALALLEYSIAAVACHPCRKPGTTSRVRRIIPNSSGHGGGNENWRLGLFPRIHRRDPGSTPLQLLAARQDVFELSAPVRHVLGYQRARSFRGLRPPAFAFGSLAYVYTRPPTTGSDGHHACEIAAPCSYAKIKARSLSEENPH